MIALLELYLFVMSTPLTGFISDLTITTTISVTMADFNGFYGGVAGHPVAGHLGYLGHPGYAGHLGHRAGFLASHEFNAIAAEQVLYSSSPLLYSD